MPAIAAATWDCVSTTPAGAGHPESKPAFVLDDSPEQPTVSRLPSTHIEPDHRRVFNGWTPAWNDIVALTLIVAVIIPVAVRAAICGSYGNHPTQNTCTGVAVPVN